jgi:hypothetical protein
MSEDELKQFLDENRAAIQLEVKNKMIARLVENQRWEISGALAKTVNDFVETEILPEVVKHLQSEKGAIMSAAIQAASGIGDMVALKITERAAKVVATEWDFKKVITALFNA